MNQIQLINLSSWINKYDQHPSGLVMAKIFRNEDFDSLEEFKEHFKMMKKELGVPSNVNTAYKSYVKYAKKTLKENE